MGRKKKNSVALEELVKSNFVSSLKENYLHHIMKGNLSGIASSTITLNVYKDGSVKYAEKFNKYKREMKLKDPNDVSSYQKTVNPATIRLYRILYSACSRAEGILTPQGLATKGYLVTITISKDAWKNYSLSFRLRYETEKLDRS